MIESVGVREIAESFSILDNGGKYRRTPGMIIGAPRELADAYRIQSEHVEVSPPDAIVAVLRNVTVYDRGVIVTSDSRIVRESLINTWGQLSFGPFRRDEPGGRISMLPVGAPIRYDGPQQPALLKQMYDRNYGHWLIESFPRATMIQECFTQSPIAYVVGDDANAIGQVYRDSLDMIGVPLENIVPVADQAMFFDELIYPTPITSQPWIKAPRVIDFLEKLSLSITSAPGPARLYITRNAVGRRALLNEQEVVEKIKKIGYEVVDPGSLSFSMQIQLFRSATHIIGNLGAAITNIVFAPRGVRFLALTSEYMQDDFFWDLVAQKAGEYFSLHGKATAPSKGMDSDFSIDVQQLEYCLERMHI